jgi:carboxyl-terminal processing protease
MSSRTKYLVVSSSTCLTILLLIGSVIGKGASPDDTLKHIGVFSDVVAHIKSEYVEEPDMKSVTLGALNGLLEAVDPFASYLNANQYKEYLKSQGVQRADVGLLLSKRSGYMGVVAAVPNSPAAKAGLSTDDMIESIKGIATRDMPLAYANLLLQGEPGTTVDIGVVRVRRPEPQTIKLTREILSIPPVESKILEGGVGYLNLDALSASNVKQAAAEIQKLQKQGVKKWIVDVRGCALGTPEDGIALANLFLDKGRITYLEGQRVPRQNFDADPAKAITMLPVAVLTNHGTAEGAEIFAAAIQDNHRGQVVGDRTYGEAAVRKAITMDDGSAIILSVAKYYPPNGGKAIQDSGVIPGTLVADAGPQMEYDDNGDPIPGPENQAAPAKNEADPVLKKALEVLANQN